MSWQVNFIGLPEKIDAALKAHSDKLTGASKEEFDAALPHFRSLLAQNYDLKNGNPVLQLIASGHGHEGYRTLSFELKWIGGSLV